MIKSVRFIQYSQVANKPIISTTIKVYLLMAMSMS